MASRSRTRAERANSEDSVESQHASFSPQPRSGGDVSENASVAGVPQNLHRLAELVNLLANQPQGQARAGPALDPVFEKLGRMGAKDFEGTTDPAKAEDWLNETERVLDRLHCTPEKRLEYIVSLLKKHAFTWWESIEKAVEPPRQLTYDDFKKEFADEYMPRVYRDQKKVEFYSLKQGSMTVADYELRFNELARYAPEAVTTEEDKCYRFEQGLRLDIQKFLVVKITEFKTLKEAATRGERILMEDKRVESAKRRHSESQGEPSRSFKRGNSFTHSGGRSGFQQGASSYRGGGRSGYGRSFGYSQSGGEQRSYSAPSVGSGRDFRVGAAGSYERRSGPVPICETCGRNHFGPCWRVGRMVCYACGEPGHIQRDCPTLRGTTTPSVTVGQSSMGSSGAGVGRGRGRGRGGRGDGPGTSGAQTSQNQIQTRVYALTGDEARVAPEVITGHEDQIEDRPEENA